MKYLLEKMPLAHRQRLYRSYTIYFKGIKESENSEWLDDHE